MSDPVADTLTTLRNAARMSAPFAEFASAKMRVSIVNALKRSGFVWDYDIIERDGFPRIRVALKYDEAGVCAFSQIVSVSKPGNRVYRGVHQFRSVVQGLGISLLSTNKGVLTDKEARSMCVGGEVICNVF